jgi:pyruvate-ferredoxin/flavodoxin oxidoreductase
MELTIMAATSSEARKNVVTIDGNEAAADVAHRLSEVIVIYPITPSSTMGELADEWAAKGKVNVLGQVPDVVEMQSEAGAIGSVHGALQAGSMATTFTASQGLLLMIPNLYKIAGELTPFAMHVAARALATSALSIFGDHSDVFGVRQTGVAMLCSASVQEAHDMAAVAHAATYESRLPFIHFFDGFRTSHEVNQCIRLSDDDLRNMMDWKAVQAHRDRALTPDRPVIRGTAQNPDTYFQTREAVNRFYDLTPAVVEKVLERFASITGRKYQLFEYHGHPHAEQVVIVMGSAVETTQATVDKLVAAGRKVGMINVRLLRPFDLSGLIKALPASVKTIGVLDRTKEPGGLGEPLYLDVIAAIDQGVRAGKLASRPTVVGGRYGISSKEFTPAMAKTVFDELAKPSPKHGFTVGILDDVTHLSLKVADVDTETFDTEDKTNVRAMFFGLGADGTVGANKNSIKIISEGTDLYAQGYFVYDSKKSGAVTVSHLRFGPRPIKAPYLLQKADFVACHQFPFMEKLDILDQAREGAVFLLNSPFGPGDVWKNVPAKIQKVIIEKKLRFYVIDAINVAVAAGLGRRINTVMQTCFFAISGVLPREAAIAKIKDAVKKTYGKKGTELVEKNWKAIDDTLANLHQVEYPKEIPTRIVEPKIVPDTAPDFVKRITALMLAGKGELLPVSAFPVDGTYPTGTTQYEKRTIATEIPIWNKDVCIQCGKCAFVCPHAAIRVKAYEGKELDGAPATFASRDYKAPDLKGLKYTVQVAPRDCTGCTLCVSVCPAKDKSDPKSKAINMKPLLEHVDAESNNYDHFLKIPDLPRSKIVRIDVKGSQFFRPLFEYSGACAGCGETPYVKLMTQLFGDRMLIANATGCSSIYGGNLPTTPYCTDAHGRGPAWCNSLFEDNAEFGLGLRLGAEALASRARLLLKKFTGILGDELVVPLMDTGHLDEAGLARRRDQVAALRQKLRSLNGHSTQDSRDLDFLADYLVPKSVWMLGGDGWAYDIGYGGLDHVLSMPRKINIMVLDTEVYSNTGGQQSKSTPLGAAAKFAALGKSTHKKDLGLMAMSYGNVYVASIAFGENDNHTVKALLEAESYPGPSLIIAYSHCIAHGYDLAIGLEQQQRAVRSGIWPLYRYDPRLAAQGKSPLQIDSKPASIPVSEYTRNEARFRMVENLNPERFKLLSKEAAENAKQRMSLYEQFSKLVVVEAQKETATTA